jgi:hypothetical protein
MSDPDEQSEFPSGPWRGYYLYASSGVRHRQELGLTFKDGVMAGEGLDGVGRFVVRGRYDAGTRTAEWVKSYPGSHDVFYHGYREGKGIWGTWFIRGQSHGGFKIWPRGTGEEEEEEERAEEQVPVAAKGPALANPPARHDRSP